MLKKHLGSKWYQLAIEMGIPKTPVDIIEETPNVNVEWKIATFLEDYKFPSFPSDRQTADFILKALQRTSLHVLVADVQRELELVLNLRGTHSVCTPSLSLHCTRSILSYFCVFLLGIQSSSPYVPKMVRCWEHCWQHIKKVV